MPTLIPTVYWYVLVTAKTVTAFARSGVQHVDAGAGVAVDLKKSSVKQLIVTSMNLPANKKGNCFYKLSH